MSPVMLLIKKGPSLVKCICFTLCIVVFGMFAGSAYWFRLQEPEPNQVPPPTITNESVVQKLQGEGTLNVLEAVCQASFQVEDPGQLHIMNMIITIPWMQKTVSVSYNYKVHFGIDLTRLTKEDVRISDNKLEIIPPYPELISIEPYNDRVKTTGGFLVSKSRPRDDLLLLYSQQDNYINILRDWAMQDLKESGKYEEMQQEAVHQAVETLTRLLRELSPNSKLEVSIKFK